MNWESSQNEKRKKWEESKETAFRKGKGKKKQARSKEGRWCPSDLRGQELGTSTWQVAVGEGRWAEVQLGVLPVLKEGLRGLDMLINVASSFIKGLAEKWQKAQPSLDQEKGYLNKTYKVEHF